MIVAWTWNPGEPRRDCETNAPAISTIAPPGRWIYNLSSFFIAHVIHSDESVMLDFLYCLFSSFEKELKLAL